MEPACGPRPFVVLVDGDYEQVIARFGDAPPDLALVDALARMQVLARRLGCRLELRCPTEDLDALLELVGLRDVIGDADRRQDDAGLSTNCRQNGG